MDREPDALRGDGRALFAAARREAPPSEIRARALAAMVASRRATSARRSGMIKVGTPWLLAAAAVALGIGFTQREPDSSPIVAEPVAASPRTPPSGAASEPTPVEVPSAQEPRRVAPVPAPPMSVPRPAPSLPMAVAVPSLSAEVEALDRVRAALDHDDPATALAELDGYQRAGGRRLTAEAALLRIEALAHAGKTQEASALARDFVAANPGSPLVDRAREFLETDSP